MQLGRGSATLQSINPVSPSVALAPAAALPKDPQMTVLSRSRFAQAFAMAALLLAAACASEPTGQDALGGTTGSALPPPGVGEQAAPGAPDAPPPPLPAPTSTSQPPADSEEPIVMKGPDGTSWEASPGRDEAAYQADLEDCYRYAVAQTERDARFIDDRNAGIDTLTNQSPFSGLRQRVDEYDLRNRRTSLMSSCMESKGYARADTVLPRLEF